MNRIDATFEELKAQGRKAFIAYITAGDPGLDATIRIIRELERNGVDMVELGVPFSDPTADGPVNQEAALRALRNGATLAGIMAAVSRVRKDSHIPIILFTYYNSILQYGLVRFGEDARNAGVDGVLVLDLPPEEATGYKTIMDSNGFKPFPTE